MKKVLVTGAAGLLGSNIIKELVQKKYLVVGLIRNSKPDFFHKNVKYVKGNLLDIKSLKEAIKGCDYIIHASALAKPWPTKSKRIFEVNLKGTKNVVNVCKHEKIKRFVFVSTANCFLPGTRDKPGTENQIENYVGRVIDYAKSKLEAQKYILKQKIVHAIIVAPTFMIGEGGLSSNELIRSFVKGKVPGYSNGGKNFIYVRDVAIACVNALTKGKVGESYLLANKNLSYKEFFKMISNIAKVKNPKIKIPNFLVIIFGAINSIISRITGKKPALSYTMAKYSIIEAYYTGKKSVKELDLPQTDIKIAVEKSLDWLKKNKYI